MVVVGADNDITPEEHSVVCVQELECTEAELSKVAISVSVYVYCAVFLTPETIKIKL